MVIKKGNTAITIVNVERTFDPQTGVQATILFQGFEGAINSTAAAATAAGAKSRVVHFQGPVYRAYITYGDAQDGSAEVPVDRWERVTEYAQEPLELNPKVIASAGDTETLALWLKEIKAAVAAGTGLEGTVSDQEQALYDLMARGAQNHELKRFVLRRRRTISLNYADVAVANAVENIYTTARLVAAFAVPTAVASKLPAAPARSSPGCVWSWKERADDSQYTPAYNKSEEVKDWVFSNWPTLLYDLLDV